MTAPTITRTDRLDYARTVYLSWPKGTGPAVTIRGGTQAAPKPIRVVLADVTLTYRYDPEDGGWSADADAAVYIPIGIRGGYGERSRNLEFYRHPELAAAARVYLAEHHPGTRLTITEERVPA